MSLQAYVAYLETVLRPVPGVGQFVEALDTRLVASGTWLTTTGDTGHPNSRYCATSGNTLTLTTGFIGNGLRVGGYNETGRPDIKCTIDGVDYFVPQTGTPNNFWAIHDITGLPFGLHTLTITCISNTPNTLLNYLQVL